MRIKSKTKKIALWSIIVAVAAVAVCVTPMIVDLENVFAYQIVVGKERPAGRPQDRPGTEWVKVDDEQECVQYSGAANVESVKEACRLCFDSNESDSARGTLWFNSSPSERNSDVIKVEDPSASTVELYLWGQVFSCAEYPWENNAYHIWFGGKDQDTDIKSQALPYLSPNDGTRTKPRGLGTYWYNYIWLTAVPSQPGWTLDVQAFKQHSGTKKIGITESGYERYEAEVSVNRCYNKTKNEISYYSSSRSDCYGDNSKIILEIAAADDSGFTSKSRVQSKSDTKESSDWGRDAETLEVTADSDGKATVYFSHKLAYRNPSPDGTYEDAYTTGTITFNDGTNESYTVPFSTNGATNAETPNWLTSNTGIAKTITLNKEEKEREICSTITYTTRTVKWSKGTPHVAEPVMDSGSTKACAKVKRDEDESPKPTGYFYSQTFIDIASQNDVVRMTATSDIDGMMEGENPGKAAYAEFSTDAEITEVTFYHQLSYVNEYNFAEDDIAPKVSTSWKIEENPSLNDTWEIDGKNSAKSDPIGKEEVSVHLNKGETKLVCRTDYYTPKYIKMKVKDGGDRDGENGHKTNHLYYEFEIDEKTGEGRSQGCVKITRPNDPEGTPWSGRGTDDSSPMFAGETATIGWNVSADSVPTRRLAYYQSINYLVPVTTQYNAISLRLQGKLGNRTNITPCSFYQGIWVNSGYNCVELGRDSEPLSYGPTVAKHEYKNSQLMAVPNEVGYKHCNSAGYFYEYWRRVCTIPEGCRWVHESAKDYWSIYNSSCRTIAKKPSVALWNGGLMTSGNDANVTGVMAHRFDTDDLFGRYADESGSRTLYGSWTEHLATIGGQATRFGSGSALGRGLAGEEESSTDKYSPLTITNTDSENLGHSGVFSTSTLLTRLSSYLRGTAEGTNPPGYGIYAGVNSLYDGWTGTRVVDVHGSLRIEHSICTNGSNSDGTCRAGGPYADIYQIPQAIIFVDGNVEIAPEVREIDAWIIASGGIDTCAGFTVGDTETQAKNYPNAEKAICEKQLKFNGPVFASRLKLNRTFGSDPSTGSAKYEPAEIFNLSADTYLWAYAQAGRYQSSYTEAYSRELPPRY